MPCTDKNFIQRLKHGDERAIEYIVDKFLPAVKGAVYRVLPDSLRNEREDCIQDVFLSVWYHKNSFTGSDADDFKKWIYKIAKYKAIDYCRKACRKKSVSMDSLPDIADSLSAFEYIESQEGFSELIEELADADKKIFTMKYALGMSSEEIAGAMNMTRAAVDNRIYRGKKRIDMKIKGLREVSV